jgi:hypothetical protein
MYAGSFVHYSYVNQREIFEFHRPHTIDFLFSYRKGWFVYTPVMLLAMAGLFMLIGKKTMYGTAFLIFTPVTIYVLSAWSCWWYATSFGQRSMIQSYPVFLICIGFLMQQLFSKGKMAGIAVVVFMAAATAFNQFQLWQVDHGIMPLDRVTKDYYWAVFGKTEYPQGADTLLMIEHSPARVIELPRKWRYRSKGTKYPVRKPDSSGVYFLVNDPKTWPHIEFVTGDMQDEQYAWYRVSFDFKLQNPSDSVKCTLIETMVDNHVRGFGWESFPFYADAKKIGDGWMHFENYYLTPVKVLQGDFFQTYPWFEGDKMMVRNFTVRIFKPKPE